MFSKACIPRSSTQRSKALSDVARALKQHDHFLICGHVDPDPDSIGSVLALDWALQRLGKTSIAVTPGEPLREWHVLPRLDRLRLPSQIQDDEWRTLVVLDCEVGRTGPIASWVPRAELTINIDHHVTNQSQASIRLVDAGAAATGEIVYDLIETLQLDMDNAVCTLLFTAMASDTGFFRFSNTTARVMSIAASLVNQGVKADQIASALYECRSWGYMQVLREALQTLERSADGQAAWITLSADLLAEEDLSGEVEGLVQYPRMIEGVEVALVFKELAYGVVRVGFRSRGRLDVSRLAQEFGGGGHKRAAGCTIEAPLAEAKQRVLARVQKMLLA